MHYNKGGKVTFFLYHPHPFCLSSSFLHIISELLLLFMAERGNSALIIDVPFFESGQASAEPFDKNFSQETPFPFWCFAIQMTQGASKNSLSHSSSNVVSISKAQICLIRFNKPKNQFLRLGCGTIQSFKGQERLETEANH